jgi:hypothetical protein
MAIFSLSLKKIIIYRKSERSKDEIRSAGKSKVKTAPILQIYTVRKCRKRPMKQIFIIKRQLNILKRSAVSAGKTTCDQ